MADGNKLPEITIRKLEDRDVEAIYAFFDTYMRADWFETKARFYYKVAKQASWNWIAEDNGQIVGVAVVTGRGALIHLLVHPDYRGKGIGQRLLEAANPPIIRSKSDQTTGDPKDFYLKNGYRAVGLPKVGRKRNIELLERVD
jgi:GNAT superfamily N-acetyltransferase